MPLSVSVKASTRLNRRGLCKPGDRRALRLEAESGSGADGEHFTQLDKLDASERIWPKTALETVRTTSPPSVAAVSSVTANSLRTEFEWNARPQTSPSTPDRMTISTPTG